LSAEGLKLSDGHSERYDNPASMEAAHHKVPTNILRENSQVFYFPHGCQN
jgi:hypothetical protein